MIICEMKSYTNLEQSRKLAEILPLDTADMCYPLPYEEGDKPLLEQGGFGSTPCWSLAALLDILYPNITLDHTEGEGWSIITNIVEENPTSILQDIITEKVIAETPIDACVEMIYKLKENDLI